MRNAFSKELVALAAGDPRIVLLSGDIGNRQFDGFKAAWPDRFYNCGVAEANMIGVAAGLALSGFRPVVYTIVPFLVTRCVEQIRIDLCYHRLPVVLVGVGGGLAYAELGATHQSCEDVATMRLLPDMTVVCPGDAVEVRLAFRASLKRDGPVYIRIGKKNEPVVHGKEPAFEIGKAIRVREGRDVCILGTGSVLPVAVEAAGLLEKDGLSVQVMSFHTVKPLDVACLEDAFARFRLVATVEEHSVLGGLGGSVAEWLAGGPSGNARFLRLGTPDRFILEAGHQGYIRGVAGLTPGGIASRILDGLGRKP